MDNALIKSLIDALEASALSELEYSKDGVTLRLVKGAGGAVEPAAARTAVLGKPPKAADPARVVAAPSFGVVHLQRSPGVPPLVTVGQAIEAGRLMCFIEAMKVFTELRAERDGTVAAILVESGQEVEAGQLIFRWE